MALHFASLQESWSDGHALNLSPRPHASRTSSDACGPSVVLWQFHRNHVEEPLYPTNNRSLPGAHLSTSLCAHVGALASTRLGDGGVHAALSRAVCSETGLSLPKLARETGVSISRFERLVELVRLADEESAAVAVVGERCGGAAAGLQLSLPGAGSGLLMRLLWLRSSAAGKPALLHYLETLEANYGPILLAPLQPDAADFADFAVMDLSAKAVRRAVDVLFPAPATPPSGVAPAEEPAAAFEVVAAALALGGSRSAPLLQGRYSYRDQPPVADCAELVTRELLNSLLWSPEAQAFDGERLPPTARPELVSFYAPGGPAHHERAQLRTEKPPPMSPHAPSPAYTHASAVWFEMVSGRKAVRYLTGTTTQRYEMAPTVENVVSCLGVLLGSPLRTVRELEAYWRQLHPNSRLTLRVSTGGDRLFALEPVPDHGDHGDQPIPASDRVPKSRLPPPLESSSGGGGLRPALELVMSERLNHAFAVHHTRPPAWHCDVAQRAAGAWASASPSRAGEEGETDSAPRPASPAECVPTHALLPGLLQPLAQRPELPSVDVELRRLLLLRRASWWSEGLPSPQTASHPSPNPPPPHPTPYQPHCIPPHCRPPHPSHVPTRSHPTHPPSTHPLPLHPPLATHCHPHSTPPLPLPTLPLHTHPSRPTATPLGPYTAGARGYRVALLPVWA